MFRKRNRKVHFIELPGKGFAERHVMDAGAAKVRTETRRSDLVEREWKRLGDLIANASGEGFRGVTFNEPVAEIREQMKEYLMMSGYTVDSKLLSGTDAFWISWSE